MAFRSGIGLLNELAGVLPIPMNCRELTINIAVDSVPTITIECLLTDEETKEIQSVFTQYELKPLAGNSDGMGQQQDSIHSAGKDDDETGAAGARANPNAGRSDRQSN